MTSRTTALVLAAALAGYVTADLTGTDATAAKVQSVRDARVLSVLESIDGRLAVGPKDIDGKDVADVLSEICKVQPGAYSYNC